MLFDQEFQLLYRPGNIVDLCSSSSVLCDPDNLRWRVVVYKI